MEVVVKQGRAVGHQDKRLPDCCAICAGKILVLRQSQLIN
jgi:hypothetical protein